MADRFARLGHFVYPRRLSGVQAEERGQAEAIARSTEQCLSLGVPLVTAIVGEGGSGGAIALAAANRVLMLEYSVYSVISPEGCASILWRAADKAADAAEAMRITASDLLALGVIERIIAEPDGGAHRIPAEGDFDLARRSKRIGSLSSLAPRQSAAAPREKFLACLARVNRGDRKIIAGQQCRRVRECLNRKSPAALFRQAAGRRQGAGEPSLAASLMRSTHERTDRTSPDKAISPKAIASATPAVGKRRYQGRGAARSAAGSTIR